jgi:hypothetical protein
MITAVRLLPIKMMATEMIRPGDPRQQDGPQQFEARIQEEQGNRHGQHQPHQDRQTRASEHRPPPLRRRSMTGHQHDDQPIVAREYDIDQNDLSDLG